MLWMYFFFIGNLFCRLLHILKSHSGKFLTDSHCYAERFVNSCPVTNHTRQMSGWNEEVQEWWSEKRDMRMAVEGKKNLTKYLYLCSRTDIRNLHP